MPDDPVVPGVYIEETSFVGPAIVPVPTSETAFVDVFARGPVDRATRVTGWRAFEASFGGVDAASEASWGVRSFFDNGGTVAWIVRIDPAGPWRAGGAERARAMTTALERLAADGQATFSLLCLPAAAMLAVADHATVVRAGIACCHARHAMLLLDARPQDTAATVASWIGDYDALRTPDAALFVPRLLVHDPLAGGGPRAIGASGAVAGLCARTDRARGIWKAPAGSEARVHGITGLSESIDSGTQAALDPRAVNVVRQAMPMGTVVRGSRTLDGADDRAGDYRYIPTRRVVRWIEASLARGLAWTVFEPNDERLQARIRASVSDFLMRLFHAGAFAGDTMERSCFVRCDATTTTGAELAQGIVRVVVGVAPVRPAEFVLSTLVLRTAGA